MTPRLGLVAYGTATGLGYQTRAIHDHLHPDRTLVIDLSSDKGMPLHPEWFPGARIAWRTLGGADIDWLLDGIDVLLVCETPISYELFDEARSRGVRTVLQPNFEFLDYLAVPHGPNLPKPTVLAAPSPWNVDRIPADLGPVWDLPVPIDPTGIVQRQITEAKTFLHVAGRPAARDRNGTLDYLDAANRCRDLDAHWILTLQSPTRDITKALRRAPHVEVVTETLTPADLYTRGDILILPRRYGGLCMPALEAMTAGMPVLMPAISPNTSWLPGDWLIPARKVDTFRAKTLIDIHAVDAGALEATIRCAHREPPVVTGWATRARALAAERTWDALLPLYRDTLTRVMELQP